MDTKSAEFTNLTIITPPRPPSGDAITDHSAVLQCGEVISPPFLFVGISDEDAAYMLLRQFLQTRPKGEKYKIKIQRRGDSFKYLD